MAQGELDKIKERLQKILKHQKSAEEIGNLEEAATFATKAQELMAKYNIENFKVRDERPADAIGSSLVNLNEMHKWSKVQGDWMMKMYSTVARFNFCKIVISDYTEWPKGPDGYTDFTKRGIKTHRIWVLGEPLNIEMVKHISVQLIERLKVLQRQAWKDYTGYEKKGTFKRGYFLGAVVAIGNKLYAQQEESKKQYEGMTGLIKLTDIAIQDKMREMFGELKARSSRGTKSSTGFHKGIEDGRKLDIHKGMEGKAPGSKLLS